MYVLTILTWSLKIYVVRLYNLISINLFLFADVLKIGVLKDFALKVFKNNLLKDNPTGYF